LLRSSASDTGGGRVLDPERDIRRPYSDWIEFEIYFARHIGRPIIDIEPWASTMIPVAVQNGAEEIVGWNRASIVSAIRNRALPTGK
jgi:hypothetical protein